VLRDALAAAVRGRELRAVTVLGPPGIGKTVWTACLYRRAMWNHLAEGVPARGHGRRYFPVWRLTTKEMLDEHTEHALKQAEEDWIDRRRVTAEKVNHLRTQQGLTPRLFLEEIDKVKETESRRANLFSILDAMMAQQGQLVLNSNLTPEEFSERFGADLWWRIEKASTVVDLF
jgi:DNA replication protein DnaC